MESLKDRYGKDVAFFLVYIREAHPTDGWQLGANHRENILFAQPTTKQQRIEVAKSMCGALEISLPTLIDGLDDAVGRDYAAWPDRLFLVGRDGKIAFQGGRGPGGFRPPQLETAIRRELGLKDPRTTNSRPPQGRSRPQTDSPARDSR